MVPRSCYKKWVDCNQHLNYNTWLLLGPGQRALLMLCQNMTDYKSFSGVCLQFTTLTCIRELSILFSFNLFEAPAIVSLFWTIVKNLWGFFFVFCFYTSIVLMRAMTSAGRAGYIHFFEIQCFIPLNWIRRRNCEHEH